jgi:hypothetical protein
MVNREKIEEYFSLGIFAIAMLFALIAIFGLYNSINNLIGIWLDYKYQPIFQALYSLSILAVCIYFIRERLIKK